MSEIRRIDVREIERAVYELLRSACVAPGADIEAAAKRAMREESGAAGEVMRQICENMKLARATGISSCQETGMALVFLGVGRDVHLEGDHRAAVERGVRRAYGDGYFRKSVVTALGRVNTGDNTPAIIYESITPGDRVEITVMPKGFGSENMSAVAMLKPSDGVEGVVRFVEECVLRAGPNPCPPVVLGVGIGGSFEYAAYMAKRALLREAGSENPNPQNRALEREILSRVNSLGIGPMGLPGRNYCFAVHIEEYPTHIAALPVAVNFCCHALRHARRVI